MKKIAVGNLGAEERAQTEHKVITRAQTRAEADLLFNNKATEIAAANQKRMKQLFAQASGAETMAPSLAKTAAVDAFFDQLEEKQKTAAQRRYPELLKASAAPGGRGTFPVASAKKSVPGGRAGAHPSTSSLSGGAA